jgi:hypothetical protein
LTTGEDQQVQQKGLTSVAQHIRFDPEALREKYRAERDRRLRKDGNAQYVRTTGRFAHYLDDPYADPNFTRDPIVEETEIVIIGVALAACSLRHASPRPASGTSGS